MISGRTSQGVACAGTSTDASGVAGGSSNVAALKSRGRAEVKRFNFDFSP